jgi:hypothetical protein
MHLESTEPEQTALPHAAPPAEDTPAAADERTIEATYRDGVLHPREPLRLPPDTPLRLRLVLPAAAPPAADPAPPPQAPDLPRPLLLTLLGGALGLGALGQYMLLENGGFTWSALLCYLLAALVFGLTLTWDSHPWLWRLIAAAQRTPAGTSAPAASEQALIRHPWQWAALLVAPVLILVLLWQLQREPPLDSYNWGLPVWMAALGLYVAAVAAGSRGAEHPAEPEQQGGRWLLPALAALLLLAFGLRVWNLGTIPETLGGDEGSQGLEAMRVLEGKISNPFGTGWLGVPTMSFYFNALSIGPLGNTIVALRLPWVLIGTLTVLVMFLLTRRLFGLTLALLTAALLATYHYHIHFSRLGSNQVADTLFVALALWLLYRGYDRRSALDWALCGLVIGAAQFFYAGARFTAVVTIAVLGFLALRDGLLPFARQRWRELLVLASAALLSSAPMIQYAIRFPNEYNARVNQVGVIQSGWLESEQEIRGEGALTILFDQAQRAFLAFNFYPDRNVWYGSDEPLLQGVAAALFALGVGYASLHLWNRRMYPMVAWWGGATILGGMLTESPPSSQRLITLAAPAMFFVALALVKIGQHVFQPGVGRGHRRLYTGFLGGAAVALTLLSLHWYFIEFTPQQRYGGYNGVVATSIGKYARDELGPEWQMYFVGPPRMYIGFGSIPYIAADVEGVDIHEPLTAPISRDIVDMEKNAVFILLPERREELQMIRATFPGGKLETVPSPVPGIDQPLYLLYQVPREQLTS